MIASVVLPVRNMAATIDGQLRALAQQQSTVEWELIVVDNGSTDATVARADQVCVRHGGSWRVVRAPAPLSSGHARNVGAQHATGRYLLFCDGDDEVSAGWVDAMAIGLERTELVTGPLDHVSLNTSDAASALREFGVRHPPVAYDFLPYALSCNVGVRREVFDALDGFDARLRSGGDMDFSWRAQCAGYELGFADDAIVRRRLPTSARAQLRRHFRYARTAPLLYRRFANHGMPRSSATRAAGHVLVLLARSPELLLARRRYAWATSTGHRIGRIVGSIEHRTLYP
jgi:glycosyltransferase involved in cell wall biosynthesis